MTGLLARQLADQPELTPEETAFVHMYEARQRLASQPEGFVEEPSVSGRSTPLPLPLPVGFAHDVRFHGGSGGSGLSVYCQPCHWGTWIDDGHDLGDLIRLVAMHAGAADVTIAATEALMALLQPLVVAP